MAKSEIVTFKETLKEVKQSQIDSGFAVEKMKTEEHKQHDGSMKKVEVGTGIYEHKGQVTYGFPESLDEATQMWGDAVVLAKALATVRIDVGKVAKAGETPEQSQTLADAFIPAIGRKTGTGGLSSKALQAQFSKLSAEQQKQILELLMASQKEAA